MTDEKEKIILLERQIAELPAGYISKKNIRGRIRFYLQWTEDGKKKSKYLDDETAHAIEPLIEKRRQLQKELKRAKAELNVSDYLVRIRPQPQFQTKIRIGNELQGYMNPVRSFKRRNAFEKLLDYLVNEYDGKVFILFGLRRTGKTTLIRQALLTMDEEQLSRAAVIRVQPGDTLAELNHDLKLLEAEGYRYVFIDEVTLAEDFIEGAALFSDIYASSGMKIVLSGTDSLGFLFSESEELYDRCLFLHTTWIPYREFEEVLGIKGIDEYIRFGGTMSLSGKHYNETSVFATKKSTDDYVDSAIARNIQHSLRNYQDGSHFRHLADLYEKGELTSAVNRVVEDMNHRFTVEILTKDFISNDLGISARNLRKDRKNPTDILDRIDRKSFQEGLRRALEILNRPEQTVKISESHTAEIKEYLGLLELTAEIETESIPVKNGRLSRTVIAQPGIRYAQAEAFIRQLLLDEEFQGIEAGDRKLLSERILNEIRGRMMEEIVLLETKKVFAKKNVFTLQFAKGEFDMVVADPQTVTCELYEIKHSTEAVPAQCVHLRDSAKCEAAAFRYGRITKKAVIYRGENLSEGDVSWINVEEYLKTLPVAIM